MYIEIDIGIVIDISVLVYSFKRRIGEEAGRAKSQNLLLRNIILKRKKE